MAIFCIVMFLVLFGGLVLMQYIEFKEDKEKVEALGAERARLVEEIYKLCEDMMEEVYTVRQEELVRFMQERVYEIEQEIERLNEKWH